MKKFNPYKLQQSELYDTKGGLQTPTQCLCACVYHPIYGQNTGDTGDAIAAGVVLPPRPRAV